MEHEAGYSDTSGWFNMRCLRLGPLGKLLFTTLICEKCIREQGRTKENENEMKLKKMKKKSAEEAQSVYKQSPGSISIPAWWAMPCKST